MGKRIEAFIRRLPPETRQIARNEVAKAEVEGAHETPIRKMLPGEPRVRGPGSYRCAGKTWDLSATMKSGMIQRCPQENLQYIRYNLDYDDVDRYCPRCAEYKIAHPEDRYMQGLDIPPEVPKLGWRPNPMPKGWKP